MNFWFGLSYVLLSVFLFIVLVYLVSRIQMKGWLHELDTFLNVKLDSYSQQIKENESKEK